jgi:hypothetical protein
MARLINKLASSVQASSMARRGEARDRPKDWMEKPVTYHLSIDADIKAIGAKIEAFCNQEKITMTIEDGNTSILFQRKVMGFSRWECALAAGKESKAELVFLVVGWYDNAGNNIPILKLVSELEKTLVTLCPDTTVTEGGKEHKLASLY